MTENMTENTIKYLVGRDLINLRDALRRCRPFVVDAQSNGRWPHLAVLELLMRIDTLVYRHADPELDAAKRWAIGDYRPHTVALEEELFK